MSGRHILGIGVVVVLATAGLTAQAVIREWDGCRVASVQRPYADGDWRLTVRCEREGPDDKGFLSGWLLVLTRPDIPLPPPPPPPPPEDPPPPPEDPTDETRINVNGNPQELLNSGEPGTKFVFVTGTHTLTAPLVAKDGQTFRCEAGASLTGANVVRHAFIGSAKNLSISSCLIEGFASPAQSGAIQGDTGDGWIVQNNEIRNNHGYAVRIGHRMKVLNNHLHHNGQLGIGGIGDDVLVEGNEIAYNNFENKFDPGWEAGGSKFVLTNRLVVRKNFVHHNTGPGLWTDINNIHSTIESNIVQDNQIGIFHEISYAAVIRNNTGRRNGLTRPFPEWWLYGACILVAHSRDVEVYGNTCEDNYNGITAIQQNRPEMPSPHGLHELVNLHVHDNTIVQKTRYPAGLAQDTGDLTVFTSKNNRFFNNRYTLGTATAQPRPFAWANGDRTITEWQAAGHDVTGSFIR